MDGANQRFMTGKVQWLNDHLIVYNVLRGTSGDPFGQGVGAVGTTLPVQQFDLRKVGAMQTAGGGAAKEYELCALAEHKAGNVARAVGRNTHAINAYFLPWGSMRTYCGRLGTNADFFFTPTLNGCTFVYSDNGQTPSVAHSNFVDPVTTLADQNAMDADLNAKFGGPAPANRLVKANYKRIPTGNEDYRATVIGIRSAAGWQFYYQNYKVESLGTGRLTSTGLNMVTVI